MHPFSTRARSSRIALWLLVFGSVTAAHAQDTSGVGSVRGSVVDSASKPAADVAICIPVTSQCEVTAADGRFAIANVRAGSYQLEIIAPGRPGFLSQNVDVRAGRDATVEITLPNLEGLEQTVTVTAPAFVSSEEIKSSSFLIPSTDISASAGALQDVARYVQALPGVVIGANDFRNDLIVRGGSPLENLFIVDNVEIPNINTFATFASAGGSVSMLDAALIQDVTFLTGGFSAAYGNRTSAVLQVAQREGSRERTTGRATFGFAGAGGVVEGPIGRGRKGSWVLSARRSMLDLVTDDIGVGGVPVQYTVNAKALYDLSPRDRVWVVNITGIDELRLGLTSDTDPDSELSAFDIRYDGWRSATGLNWQRTIGSRGVGLLGLSMARATVNQQVKDLFRGGIPGRDVSVEDQIAGGAVVFREGSSETELTAKYDLTLSFAALGKVQGGVAVKRFLVDYDAASPFGTDSPYFPVADLNPFAVQERLTASQASAYLQVSRALTSRLRATVGGRVEHFGFLDATQVNPRLGLDYDITSRLSLRASYGQYHQQPFFLFLTAYPENRALDPFRADHYVAGAAYTFGPSTRLTVEAYHKTYRDYPVSSQIPALSLANVGDTFAIRDIIFPMVGTGRGESNGVEVFFERKPNGGRWQGQANLGISRTRHGGLDGVLRPGSYDYPVVANLLGGYQITPKWDASLRVAYLAGRPITPYDTAASLAQRRAVYDLSRVNSERLPDYIRTDIRVDRHFTVKGQPVSVFAGVQNVANRRNVAGYSWDRRKGAVRVNDQQGIFPILGIDWRF